jgi:hypothetical protein
MNRVLPTIDHNSTDFKLENVDRRRLTKLDDIEANKKLSNEMNHNQKSKEIRPSKTAKEKPDAAEEQELKDFDLKKEILNCISQWAGETTCKIKHTFSVYLMFDLTNCSQKVTVFLL